MQLGCVLVRSHLDANTYSSAEGTISTLGASQLPLPLYLSSSFHMSSAHQTLHFPKIFGCFKNMFSEMLPIINILSSNIALIGVFSFCFISCGFCLFVCLGDEY